ncbi:hypothetical protein [Streptomyces sp. NPDC017993]|uniref:hypothetical protein n=1 Tax=Streptomyces sp. NPDC017993 TaxID=3365027 RepID=UPI00379B48C8
MNRPRAHTADRRAGTSGSGRRSGGEAVGAVISAAVLTAANTVVLYVVYLALAISPDGPWDVRESADDVRILSLTGGALASAVALLTVFLLATRWLRSRWWLAAPALMLLCAVVRWLLPS